MVLYTENLPENLIFMHLDCFLVIFLWVFVSFQCLAHTSNIIPMKVRLGGETGYSHTSLRPIIINYSFWDWLLKYFFHFVVYRTTPYVIALVVAKFLHTFGLFVTYEQLKVIHVVQFLFVVRLWWVPVTI